MDHAFYDLDEASTLLGCTIKDLMKWGAAGKIDVCVWYDKAIRVSPKLFDYYRDRGVSLPKDSMESVNKFLPLFKEDIMRMMQQQPRGIDIYMLRWPEGPRIFLENDLIGQSPDDLFITAETLNTLKAEIGKTPIGSATPCLDEENDFHSKELKIAIEAWTALFDKKEAGDPVGKIKDRPGGAIKAIMGWLEKNYPGESGKAYERIAGVINPNPFKVGGAPKRIE